MPFRAGKNKSGIDSAYTAIVEKEYATPDVHSNGGGGLMCALFRVDRSAAGALLFAMCVWMVAGCGGKAQAPTPPAPEVSVMEIKGGPITVYDEYVAQTQAPDTIEIRAQVTGLLGRQGVEEGGRGRAA